MSIRSSCFVTLTLLLVSVHTSLSWIDTTNRWQSRDYFNFFYSQCDQAELGWTGDFGTGEAGELSEGWQEATRQRVRYFRNMAGIPDEITFDPELSSAAQEAAFMMSFNRKIDHYPAEDWTYFTPNAYEAAQNGNLGYGVNGPHAVDGYMIDFGDHNKAVGHRRWLLFPYTTVMGNGDAPGHGVDPFAVNVLWVIPDFDTIGPRPATRDAFVAWPPPGHVPAPLVYARWSFSLPGADFSSATVSMESGGEVIPVTLEPWNNLMMGDPTLVWVPDGMTTIGHDYWPTPDSDETVTVTVDNLMINGISQAFDYEVTIFDPSKASPVEEATILSAYDPIVPTVPIRFNTSPRPWAEGVQGRVFKAQSIEGTLGAENGLAGFQSRISPGYVPVQSQRVSAGQQAYHLAHPERHSQSLTTEDFYLVKGDLSPRIAFSSSLSWATENQVALVEISFGCGGNWQVVWRKSGPVGHNPSFEPVQINLDPWIGRTLRIRFHYGLEGLVYYPQTDPSSGWAFDAIELIGLERVTVLSELPPVMGDSVITVTFNSRETVWVQGREIAFEGLPLDWGPVQQVSPQPHQAVKTQAGVWAEDPVIGWNFGSDADWTYVLNLGWIYLPEFPWLYSSSGWFYYVRGSVRGGLWLHHPIYGYSYTSVDFGGWFLHEPFDAGSWKPFSP